MFALSSSLGSCLKAVFLFKCVYSSAFRAHSCRPLLDWHYACLQTRNVVETNQCPSAFPFLVVLFVPGPAALAPPCATRASSLLWMRGSVRAQTYLAGVWLAFGWCLAVVSGDLPRARTWPAGVRLHWLAGGCLCGAPTCYYHGPLDYAPAHSPSLLRLTSLSLVAISISARDVPIPRLVTVHESCYDS